MKFLRRSKQKNQAGFTLIEVMITVMILSVLTVMSSQSLQQAIKNKLKLQDQIDDVSRMRDALKLIERDINQAYHYRDLEKELIEMNKKKKQQQRQGQVPSPIGPGAPAGGIVDQPKDPSETPEDPNEPKATRLDPVTHFKGEEEKLNFVTMNSMNLYKNNFQAEFSEVGYYLRDCKSLSDEKKSSKCLVRRSSEHVDQDVTRGGQEIVLLEDVSEFKLKYLGHGKQDWNSVWHTDASGDGATKNNFPDAVEISLTIEKFKNKKKKTFSMQIVASVHFPNNAEGGQKSETKSENASPF